MNTERDIEIGRLQERTENHGERLERIEAKLDHVVKVLDTAQGGWKVLVIMGTAISVITGAVIELVNYFHR